MTTEQLRAKIAKSQAALQAKKDLAERFKRAKGKKK